MEENTSLNEVVTQTDGIILKPFRNSKDVELHVLVHAEGEIMVTAVEQMSPAQEWQLKQQNKRAIKMQNKLKEKIEAGCRIRQNLALPDGEGSIPKLLIAKVKSGDWREVEAIFAIVKGEEYSNSSFFNVCDRKGKSPLRIAIENKDVKMTELLLSEQIFNNKKIKKPSTNNMHFVWEDSYRLQMISKAISSPAYIMALSEADRYFDTFVYCMKQICELQHLAKIEHEFSGFYLQLVEDVEEFMCKLLDQIQSSTDLAAIFEYDFKGRERTETLKYIHQTKQYDSDEAKDNDDEPEEVSFGTRLRMLEKACDYKIINFVTHHNAQMAIEHLTYRNTPFFRTGNHMRTDHIPMHTSYDCRMMSEFWFVVFLVTNISTKMENLEYLGAPPTVWEWLILAWVLGKFYQEIQELNKRGLNDYFFDPWNQLDLWAIILFAVSYSFRIVDYVKYYQVPFQQRPPRSEWDMFEWRLVAEGLIACAYVFVFLRLLGLTRVNRALGPLQISLARMVVDVIQFLCIFGFIMFAFALALAELYWFYGTAKGKEIFCERLKNSNSTINATSPACTKGNPYFQGVWYSIIDLFWALFGQMDISKLSLSGKHLFTEYVAKALLAVYHIIAIIILLNMLIAMMSRSYERTSENEEKEWKFQRTKMWIRILRKETIRPPPMNLFPNSETVWYYLKRSKRLCRFFSAHLIRCRCAPIKRFFSSRWSNGPIYHAINYHKARRNLISRYKTNVL
ncbi:short transient receptor potential channel 4-like [Ciona intestinalis]